MLTKVCTKCNIEKPVSEFGKCSKVKDKKQSACKECRNLECKNWRNENQEHQKIYRNTIKEISKQQKKKWYENNKEKLKIIRNNNKEKIKQNWKNYYLNNRTQLNKKRKNNIQSKLASNLRTRISQALNGNTKSVSTMMLVGCEIDYLMYHIQSQFKPGMNWDNYGKWHIDHKRPCISFDLSDPKQQLICFNYRNLQPLWAEENLSKGSKYKDTVLNNVIKF